MQIAEHRFDDFVSPALRKPALLAIDRRVHACDLRVAVFCLAAFQERHQAEEAGFELVNARVAQREVAADRATRLVATGQVQTISSAFAACTNSGRLQPALNRT